MTKIATKSGGEREREREREREHFDAPTPA